MSVIHYTVHSTQATEAAQVNCCWVIPPHLFTALVIVNGLCFLRVMIWRGTDVLALNWYVGVGLSSCLKTAGCCDWGFPVCEC